MNSLISIIIPTYNSSAYILDTLNNVFAQSYTNIEVIVVDNNSTDDTEILLQNYINDKSIIYLKQPKKGASAARNLGLQHANGNYIQFLDADDLLHANKLKLQIELMEAKALDICYCSWSFFEDTIIKNDRYKNTMFYDYVISGRDMIKSFGMSNFYMPLHCWLTKASIIKKSGYWNEAITNNDDGEFFTRVLLQSQRIFGIQQVLCYYRRVAHSLSAMNSGERIDSAFKSYSIIENLLKAEQDRRLLSYVKRMYYVQFTSLYYTYPKMAKRAATAFDKIKAPCFLHKRCRFWWLIRCFGLFDAYKINNKLNKLLQ